MSARFVVSRAAVVFTDRLVVDVRVQNPGSEPLAAADQIREPLNLMMRGYSVP
jgi:hypothetical protein